MSIVTYILLAALHAGINARFNPRVRLRVIFFELILKITNFLLQILGDSASRATVVVLLDFAFVKLGCYILNITSSSQVVDLIAYGGYKFVGYVPMMQTSSILTLFLL